MISIALALLAIVSSGQHLVDNVDTNNLFLGGQYMTLVVNKAGFIGSPLIIGPKSCPAGFTCQTTPTECLYPALFLTQAGVSDIFGSGLPSCGYALSHDGVVYFSLDSGTEGEYPTDTQMDSPPTNISDVAGRTLGAEARVSSASACLEVKHRYTFGDDSKTIAILVTISNTCGFTLSNVRYRFHGDPDQDFDQGERRVDMTVLETSAARHRMLATGPLSGQPMFLSTDDSRLIVGFGDSLPDILVDPFASQPVGTQQRTNYFYVGGILGTLGASSSTSFTITVAMECDVGGSCSPSASPSASPTPSPTSSVTPSVTPTSSVTTTPTTSASFSPSTSDVSSHSTSPTGTMSSSLSATPSQTPACSPPCVHGVCVISSATCDCGRHYRGTNCSEVLQMKITGCPDGCAAYTKGGRTITLYGELLFGLTTSALLAGTPPDVLVYVNGVLTPAVSNDDGTTLQFVAPQRNSTGAANITLVNTITGQVLTSTTLLTYHIICLDPGETMIGGACVPCPEGGRCPGGNLLIPLANYCVLEEEEAPLKCNPSFACLGEGSCAAGYTGRCCDKCIHGYFKNGARCMPCEEPSKEAHVNFPLLAAAFGIVLLLLYFSVSFLRYPTVSSIVSKLLMISTVVYAARTAGSHIAGTTGERIGDYARSASVLLLDFEVVQPACTKGVENVGFMPLFWATWVGVAVALGVVFLAAGTRALIPPWECGKAGCCYRPRFTGKGCRSWMGQHSERNKEFRRALAFGIVVLFALICVQMMVRCLQALDCVNFVHLRVELSTRCWEGEHRGVGALAIITLVALFAPPVIIILVLAKQSWNRCHKHPHHHHHHHANAEAGDGADANATTGETANGATAETANDTTGDAGSTRGTATETAEEVEEEEDAEEEGGQEEERLVEGGERAEGGKADGGEAGAGAEGRLHMHKEETPSLGFFTNNLKPGFRWFRALYFFFATGPTALMVLIVSDPLKIAFSIFAFVYHVIIGGSLLPFTGILDNVIMLITGVIQGALLISYLALISNKPGTIAVAVIVGLFTLIMILWTAWRHKGLKRSDFTREKIVKALRTECCGSFYEELPESSYSYSYSSDSNGGPRRRGRRGGRRRGRGTAGALPAEYGGDDNFCCLHLRCCRRCTRGYYDARDETEVGRGGRGARGGEDGEEGDGYSESGSGKRDLELPEMEEGADMVGGGSPPGTAEEGEDPFGDGTASAGTAGDANKKRGHSTSSGYSSADYYYMDHPPGTWGSTDHVYNHELVPAYQ